MTITRTQLLDVASRPTSLRRPLRRHHLPAHSALTKRSRSSPTASLNPSLPQSPPSWPSAAAPGTPSSSKISRHARSIDMPAAVLDRHGDSQVSIFAVQVQPNELHSRMQMTDVVNRRRMRHAHMVNITAEIMCEGMRADFDRGRPSQPARARPRPPPRRIRATTAAGTEHHCRHEPWLQMVQNQRHHLARKSGAICPAAKSSPRPAKSTAPSSSTASWAIVFAQRYGSLCRNSADHQIAQQPHRRLLQLQQHPVAGRFLGLHAHR